MPPKTKTKRAPKERRTKAQAVQLFARSGPSRSATATSAASGSSFRAREDRAPRISGNCAKHQRMLTDGGQARPARRLPAVRLGVAPSVKLVLLSDVKALGKRGDVRRTSPTATPGTSCYRANSPARRTRRARATGRSAPGQWRVAKHRSSPMREPSPHGSNRRASTVKAKAGRTESSSVP